MEELDNLQAMLYSKPDHLIRRLQQIATTFFLEETAQYDITPVQYGVLVAVRARPGTDQLRVAQAIGFDRNTISGVIDRLEAKELVRRETGTDRRTRLLQLTPAGVTMLEALIPATERAQVRMLAGLSDTERNTFVELLARVVHLNNDVCRVPVTALPATPSS